MTSSETWNVTWKNQGLTHVMLPILTWNELRFLTPDMLPILTWEKTWVESSIKKSGDYKISYSLRFISVRKPLLPWYHTTHDSFFGPCMKENMKHWNTGWPCLRIGPADDVARKKGSYPATTISVSICIWFFGFKDLSCF